MFKFCVTKFFLVHSPESAKFVDVIHTNGAKSILSPDLTEGGLNVSSAVYHALLVLEKWDF